MENRKRQTCSLVSCEECCTTNFRTKSNSWGCKKPFSKYISSLQSWTVHQNRVNQLRISLCNFTKIDSMKNRKRQTCSLVNCEEYCPRNIRTKLNAWRCKQPFSKWISSFQSWYVHQNRVNQLRILFCNFTKKASMKNMKRRTCSLVNCEEYCTRNVRTKLNAWGCKQPFSISDFEFSVVVVHDIRDHQRCISDHNSPKNYAITNLKRTLLRPLQYKACLTGAFKTRRRSDKGIACFGWMFSA